MIVILGAAAGTMPTAVPVRETPTADLEPLRVEHLFC